MDKGDDEARIDAFLFDVVRRFAPHEPPIDEQRPLQWELELDSLDFLGLMSDVATEFGVVVPELDYPAVSTLNGLREYLLDQLCSTRSKY